MNGKQQEAIRLLYRDDDILAVSIHSLHRVSRYTGAGGVQPKVSKLGTAGVEEPEGAKKKIEELAFDLDPALRRTQGQARPRFPPTTTCSTRLEASFIYEDTPTRRRPRWT